MKQRRRAWKRKSTMSREDRFKAFKRDIIEGPNYTCFSCNRDLFKQGVKQMKAKDIQDFIVKNKLNCDFVREIGFEFFDSDAINLCHSCHLKISKGEIPNINIRNGLDLDEIPEELQVIDLEQQLFARSLIFMKVKRLPGYSGMKAVTSKVISVPLE